MVYLRGREKSKVEKMKMINRGFLMVRPQQAFIDWAMQQDEELFLDQDMEANIYLVEEDFFEEEPVIEANFKKIFLNELEAVTDDESRYPAIKMEVFQTWFKVSAGNSVFDCEKDNIRAYED